MAENQQPAAPGFEWAAESDLLRRAATMASRGYYEQAGALALVSIAADIRRVADALSSTVDTPLRSLTSPVNPAPPARD